MEEQRRLTFMNINDGPQTYGGSFHLYFSRNDLFYQTDLPRTNTVKYNKYTKIHNSTKGLFELSVLSRTTVCLSLHVPEAESDIYIYIYI